MGAYIKIIERFISYVRSEQKKADDDMSDKKELKSETNGVKGGEINCFRAENRYLLSLNLKCYFCTNRSSENRGKAKFDSGWCTKGKKENKMSTCMM